MFSLIAKYSGLLKIGAVLLVTGLLIFGVNKVLSFEQKKGYDKAVAEYTAKQLVAEQEARAKEMQLIKKVEEARNDAVVRDQKINELSRTLASTSSGLRDTIANLRGKLSAAPRSAANKQADTVLDVLGECQARYGEVAEAADRHASDVKMLQDAWPK